VAELQGRVAALTEELSVAQSKHAQDVSDLQIRLATALAQLEEEQADYTTTIKVRPNTPVHVCHNPACCVCFQNECCA